MPIVADAVHFEYASSRGRPVLRGVSAGFEPGMLTAVIGPNGAGKSTLLRLLLGVLKPASGRVTFTHGGRGVEVREVSAAKRASRIAYIPQQSRLTGSFTVGQFVRMGRLARPADDGAAWDAVERLDLVEMIDEPFLQLSAGQQQRASLARVLAQLAGEDVDASEQVILADEPCAAMDPRQELQCMGLLREQARARAVVVILHDLGLAARYADRAVVLSKDGRVAAAGAAGGVLEPRVLSGVFEVGFVRSEPADGVTAIVPVEG